MSPTADGRLRIWHAYAYPGVDRVNGVFGAMTNLAAAQADAGHDVTVRVIQRHPFGAPAGSAAVVWSRSTVDFVRRFEHDVECRPPDVVHLHEVRRPGHAVVVPHLLKRGIPVVCSPHAGLLRPAFSRFRAFKAVYGFAIEKRRLGQLDAIVCLSDEEARDVTAHLGPATRTVVVPNALPTADWPPGEWSPPADKRPAIVTLARYDPVQKGIDVLAAIARALSEADFVVHGSPDRNHPRQFAAIRADAPSNLSFAPPVFGSEKLATLRAATMFIQPSRWEGLSVSLMEALAAGVPSAVSQYVARGLPFAENGLGLVLDPSPIVAAGQLRHALGDPTRLAVWSRTGSLFARRAFAPDAVARHTVGVYETVLGRGPGALDLTGSFAPRPPGRNRRATSDR